MNFKKRLLVFLSVISILILNGFFMRKNMFLGAVSNFVIFFCFSILISKWIKANIYDIGLTIIISLIISVFIGNLIDNNGNLSSVEMYIFPGLIALVLGILGVVSGVLVYNRRFRIFGWIFMSIIFSLVFWKGKFIYDNWVSYCYYEDFIEMAPKKIDFPFEFMIENRKINNSFTKDTTLILSFWHAGCPICIRELPVWDSISKISIDKPILILSVFIPSGANTINTAQNIFHKKGIESLLLVEGNENFKINFDFNAFPSIIILKDFNIHFKGEMKNAIFWMKKNSLLLFSTK